MLPMYLALAHFSQSNINRKRYNPSFSSIDVLMLPKHRSTAKGPFGVTFVEPGDEGVAGMRGASSITSN